VVKLVVTGVGDNLTRRPKRSLRCHLVEVPSQINKYLNLSRDWKELIVLHSTLKKAHVHETHLDLNKGLIQSKQ